MQSHANGHSNGHGSGTYPGPEGPDDASTPDEQAFGGDRYGTVGEWLSARRRAMKLSIEDVAEATRVREDYLSAIEDMDPRRMPQGPYAPGFVRTYAIHLELDPDAVAARFREEMSPSRLRTPHAARVKTPIKVRIPPQLWGGALAVAALAGLVALGWRPSQDRGDAIAVPAVPEGLSDWVAADVQTRRSSAAPELVVGPDLALRARVPVWVEARADDGEVLLSRTLAAGEIWLAPRIPGVRVSAENGAAIEILLDGSPQGRIGAAGLPVTDWLADTARPLTAPVVVPTPEELAAVEAVAAAAAGEGSAEGDVAAAEGEAASEASAGTAAPADAAASTPGQVDAPVNESAAVLSDLAAEEALVSPDLPADYLSVDDTPPPVLDGEGFVPAPEETAAAEGPAAPAEADEPPAE